LPGPGARERLLAEPCKHVALMVEYRNTRAQIRRAAIEAVVGTDLADVADRAFAGRKMQPAWSMNIVPQRLEPAVAVEHLHPVILAIGHVDPAVCIAADIVGQVELAGTDT